MLHFPFKLLRQIFWILLLLLAIVLCTNTTLAKAQIDDYCTDVGSTIERAYMFAWANMWETYEIPESDYDDLLALDISDSFWVDTAEYGYFDTPEDETGTLLVLVFITENGRRKLYLTSAPSTPRTYYGYLFTNLKPFARPDGSYYGVHPCRVFRIDTQTMNDFWYGASLRQN